MQRLFDSSKRGFGQSRTRSAPLAAMAVLLLACAAPAGAAQDAGADLSLDSGSLQALQVAVEDLTATFGTRYPDGPRFLAEMAEIAKGASSANEGDRKAAGERLGSLRRRALIASPLVSAQPMVFVVRNQYRADHHNTATFFPAAMYECNSGAYTPGGALKLLDAAGGRVTTLLSLPEGVARDPEISFDGRTILLAIRKSPQDSYHIYEVDAGAPASPSPAGARLRQLTFAKDVDDFDPLYLPDGGIAFSSTREPKYCMCNRHIMANLYRMEADGANIRQIGKSTLFEGHGSLTPDGRILYSRWEYVDRNFGDGQGLWTCNPDGTNHAMYWGNNTPSPGAVLDARVIPGADRVVCTFGACHDRPWGAMAIVDRQLGADNRPPVVRTWPADAVKLVWTPATGGGFDSTSGIKLKYEDPYPLSEKYFLCSHMTGRGEEMGIFLVDTFGNEVLVHVEPPGCFDPMPLCPRPRPGVIPARRKFQGAEGTFYVQDVYQGTHLAGVARGAVKYLRVVESPEKRFWTGPDWSGQGAEAPGMNWNDFNNKRILGTVPVEEDGSAYFSLPAETFVYFQVLDAQGKMIQSMRSGTIVQPGESSGCVGCHDNRGFAPPAGKGLPMAIRRPPSRLQGWRGPVRAFGYLAEVQPVFDKNCLACHDYGKPGAAKLILAPDRENCFNASYRQLWTRGYITVVGAGSGLTQQAYSWGSNASRLVKVIESGHHGVKLDPESLDRIITWLDLNAPYYPSYATSYPDGFAGRSPLAGAQTDCLKKLLGDRWQEVSFDRPELSPALTALGGKDPAGKNPAALSGPDRAKYQEALAILQAGKAAFAARPGADSPGFVPCPLDQWRDQKYLARRATETAVRQAIVQNQKLYDGR